MDPATAIYDDTLRTRLAAGAVLSVLAHAALIGLVITRDGSAAGFPPRLLNPPDAAVEPPPTPLGIEESEAVSINWLGFADPTEHRARPAETEQAEMSPEDPGVPIAAAPSEPTDPSENAEPVETTEPAPETEVVVEPAPTPDPTTDPAAELPEVAEAEAEAIPAPSPIAVMEEASTAASERIFRVVRQAAEAAKALAEQAEQAAREAAEQAARQQPDQQTQQQATATPAPGDTPDAVEADKTSDATSREEVIDWAPGRPLAAQGLDIKTDRPKWSTTIRIWAVPRNPVVTIEFRKNGTVAKAAFLKDRDTGYRDVDGPLLDSIYRWTATGEALNKLPAGDANARVTITMRVVLIAERGELKRSSDK